MVNKAYLASKYFALRGSVVAVASCLALSGIPLAAHAAGLGKIVVFSALGQPLRAEIEVSATREELSGMRAQLAPQDAFKQAGLDYATTLLGIRFSMDKRANGQTVIKLSSDRAINDPFIDMLLELNWPAGSLVREYTFLLDPPEIAARNAAPLTPVQAESGAAASRPAAIDDEVRSKAVAKARGQEPAPTPAPARASEAPAGGDVRVVKRGDTLNRIANETKPEGVSLEQMLVGLLRANQDAFDGGNMNRLKAGKILTVPDREAVEAVPVGEARKIVVAQSSDWNAYRSRLAAVAAQMPVKDDAARQEAAGKITAKVDDKAAPAAESKDRLKVGKSDAVGTTPGAGAKRSDEDLIAKEKALREANEREAALLKNISDLQKLVELKNQNLADLQKQAAAKAAPAETKKAPEEVKPPAPVVAEKPAEAPPPAPPVKAEEAKPKAKPAEMPKPKAKAPPPPPPVEEPGFFEELLDNPLVLAGGGGILALIGGLIFARRRRASQAEPPLDLSSTLSPPSSSLTSNSVFRNTGGQSVDTSHTPVQTDFSQAGPGSIDTDEVDPVAEADVYMAYGRNAQAEEILLEAKQKDAKRYAIHLKLLEIYSNRKDTQQFENLASELFSETGGVGADWEKAAALGAKLDPDNPLYGGAARAAAAPFDADATVIVSPRSMRNTVTMPGELSQLAGEVTPAEQAPVAVVVLEMPAVEAPDLTSLDFDLGLESPTPAAGSTAKTSDAPETPETLAEAGALDFDLAAPKVNAADATHVGFEFDQPPAAEPPTQRAEPPALDFDLDLGTDAPVAASPSPSPAPAVEPAPDSAAPEDNSVEFDVKLTESTFLGRSMPEPTSFDMSAINLDLKVPELAIPSSEAKAAETAAPDIDFESVQISTNVNPDFSAPSDGNDAPESESEFSVAQAATVVNPQFGVEQEVAPEFEISSNEEVTTKLDLAKAYEAMGDLEGARELLDEVVKEGDATQREKARAILAKIGA